MCARFGMIVALALLTTSGAAGASAPVVQLDIRGAWHPEDYHLKDGSQYDVGA